MPRTTRTEHARGEVGLEPGEQTAGERVSVDDLEGGRQHPFDHEILGEQLDQPARRNSPNIASRSSSTAAKEQRLLAVEVHERRRAPPDRHPRDGRHGGAAETVPGEPLPCASIRSRRVRSPPTRPRRRARQLRARHPTDGSHRPTLGQQLSVSLCLPSSRSPASSTAEDLRFPRSRTDEGPTTTNALQLQGVRSAPPTGFEPVPPP